VDAPASPRLVFQRPRFSREAAFLAFSGNTDRMYFRMFDAALAVRVLDPSGDWPQQLAALFAARAACNGVVARAAVPRASVRPAAR